MQDMASMTIEQSVNSRNKLPEAWQGKEIKKYDFFCSGRLSYAQTRVLDKINREVAELLASKLGKLFNCQVEMQAQAPKAIDLAELEERLQDDGVFAAFTTTSAQKIALLEMDSGFALYMVDRFLGGNGETKCEGRPLTELESQIVSEGLEIILSQYALGWAKTAVFTPKILKTWSGQAPEEMPAGSDAAVISDFRIKLNGLQGGMRFYLLLPECEALISRVTARKYPAEIAATKEAERNRVLRVIEEVELPLSAVLGKGKISLADLMEISEGDIIRLEAKQTEEAELWTGGRAEFLAKPMTINGRMAMCVLEELNREGV